MTKDDIIRMAREAGLAVTSPSWGYTEHYHFAGFEQPFERFVALVAAAEHKKLQDYVEQAKFDREAAVLDAVLAEREACAKVCEDADKSTHPADLADAIRARGQA